jgi:adenylate kinase
VVLGLMNVVFLGPPGSGKGTQAKQLAEEFKLTHLSTGDVFRENIKNQTSLGKKIKEFVDGGKLVPDSLVSDVVFDKLKQLGGNVLLDGYPRTVDQSKALDAFSKNEKFSIDSVLFFAVNAPALVKRLSARRQCPNCKEVYNLDTRAPKKAGICDNCGTALIQRPDDKAEVVQERLRVYDKETAPVLDFYGKRKEFIKIDASQEIDTVYKSLVSALRK